jgi:rhodanese-related sulfurtransferase
VGKDAEIYTICLSAHRSIGAVKWLQQQGYTKAKQLQGGMQAWWKQQLPETKSQLGQR